MIPCRRLLSGAPCGIPFQPERRRSARGRYPTGHAYTGVRARDTPSVPRTHRKLNETERVELVILFGKGASLHELGRRYGIHPQTAQQHLLRAGIVVGQLGSRVDLATRREILQQHRTGHSAQDIADKVDVSLSTVARILGVARQAEQLPLCSPCPRLVCFDPEVDWQVAEWSPVVTVAPRYP